MLMPRIIYSKKPLSLALVSLGAMLILITLTTPVSNILMGLFFFGLLLLFLISFGYLLLGVGGHKASRRAKLMVILISSFAVLALMFQSVQSLNWASGLSLTLLAAGMLFYSSRRG